MSTLAQTKFSGFPLVSVPEHQVVGLILRTKLVEVLQECGGQLIADADFSDSPSRKTSERLINLMMYADQTPEVKHWNTPLAKAHRHFMAAGLRHLCVVDETHRLVGILTRSDLAAVSHPRTRQQAIRGLLARKEASMQDAVAEGSDTECSDSTSDLISEATSSASFRGRGVLRWPAYG